MQVVLWAAGTHFGPMIWFFVLLIAGFALATASALVRGLMAFYKDGEALKDGSDAAVLMRGVQQNRMMSQRVLFQGLAILAIALLGALATQN